MGKGGWGIAVGLLVEFCGWLQVELGELFVVADYDHLLARGNVDYQLLVGLDEDRLCGRCFWLWFFLAEGLVALLRRLNILHFSLIFILACERVDLVLEMLEGLRRLNKMLLVVYHQNVPLGQACLQGLIALSQIIFCVLGGALHLYF